MAVWPASVVSESVDRLGTYLQQNFHWPPSLDEKHDRARWKRRHHRLDEVRASERRIGDRRPVEVTPTGAEIQEVSEVSLRALVAGEDAAASRQGAFKFVAADHLAHLHKYRDIRIPEPDDVQERLLLPGVADRGNVIEPVSIDAVWADASSAAYDRQQHSSQQGAHKPDGRRGFSPPHEFSC
jgi:hypothetical protein